MKDKYFLRFIAVGLLIGFSGGNLLSQFVFKTSDDRLVHNSVVFVTAVIFAVIGLAIYYRVRDMEENKLRIGLVWGVTVAAAAIMISLYITGIFL
ncbi:hypothetical protein V6R21_15690 [Limibacter armeniacum]|uniref:hypothetical protein n=1 Tax=Limibacter armeniacum TaxID=466084 RepID=UPI002FE57895